MVQELQVTIEDEAVVKAVVQEYGKEIPNTNYRVEARNQCLVAQLIQGTNIQHRGYLHHLRNSYLHDDDNYPSTAYEAYNILGGREEETHHQIKDNDGVSFVLNWQQWNLLNVRCFSCNQLGHYADFPKCPNYNSKDHGGDAVNALMFTFYQSGGGTPKSWILFNSQLTVHWNDISKPRLMWFKNCKLQLKMKQLSKLWYRNMATNP